MRRGLIAVHRWLGVALSLNFFIWFVSGIGMMYWDFPSVSAADRLARFAALDGAALKLSLSEAFAAAGIESADDVRLETFDDRPVYRLRSGRTQRVVYADTGEVRRSISRIQINRIASHWVGRSVTTAAVVGADDVDQWTVQLPLARLKPVWQYSWPEGERVYVSQALPRSSLRSVSPSACGPSLCRAGIVMAPRPCECPTAAGNACTPSLD
jgi:hypothetical protein